MLAARQGLCSLQRKREYVTATVVYVNSDLQTVWLVLGTIFAAVISAGGGIAVAVITRKQNVNEKKIDALHDAVKTSNGSTVGALVEQIADKQTHEQQEG